MLAPEVYSRCSVASIVLVVAITLLAWAFPQAPRKSVVLFELEAQSGSPSNLTVYAYGHHSFGLIAIFDRHGTNCQIGILNSQQITELQELLEGEPYRSLTQDPIVNLQCDARFAPCDEDIYRMRDWQNATTHTVACFSEEPGPGKHIADWVLEKAGVEHSYQCF